MTKINRRLFLLSTIPIPLYPAAPLAVLSAEEARVVESLCDQIVPADDAPGARQAGVLYYIDRQLAGPLGRFTPVYKTGIPAFRNACRKQTGADFADLPFAKQTDFLRYAETERKDLAPFVETVIDHTMQGFYGSPDHGGNRDEASWKMLEITDVMGGHQH
jgi:gluconate 2-dehydrogenase gamma chain